ncbi:MAG: MerR family transcriptional regulator [Alphaproteobacteria bacterium]
MTLPDDMISAATAPTLSWGIQDFAALFDTTPRTLRFYEDKGLLEPSRQAGSRVFGPNDRTQMERIARAKRLGFSLEDIKTVLEVRDGLVANREDLVARRDKFKKVIGSLRRRRTDIDVLTADLSELCDRIDTYIETAPEQSGVFKYAQAYDAALREHLDDGFGFDEVKNISKTVSS